jgi:hypothetical protein
MNKNKLAHINQLIKNKKIDQAQIELSKFGPEYFKDSEYLYLRSKIFFYKELYYIALDTLLIALEFDKKDKIYELISEIYSVLGNKDLSKKISDLDLRLEAVNLLKSEFSGIYRKNSDS